MSGVLVLDELPRGSTGKILRKELESLAAPVGNGQK